MTKISHYITTNSQYLSQVVTRRAKAYSSFSVSIENGFNFPAGPHFPPPVCLLPLYDLASRLGDALMWEETVVCRALLSAVKQLSPPQQRLPPLRTQQRPLCGEQGNQFTEPSKQKGAQSLSCYWWGAPEVGKSWCYSPNLWGSLREQFGNTRRKSLSLLLLLWGPNLISITQRRRDITGLTAGHPGKSIYTSPTNNIIKKTIYQVF